MIECHLLLLQRSRLEAAQQKQLQDTLLAVRNEIILSNEVERKFLELQNAHAAERAFESSLLDQINEGAVYKSACRRQEKAIEQLEALHKQCQEVSIPE